MGAEPNPLFAKWREKIREHNIRFPERENIKEARALLKLAGRGELSQEEIEDVADKIKNKRYKDNVELSFSILTLGKAGAVQYRSLVEQYLYYPQREFVAQDALNTLCKHWGLASEYLEQIKLFIRGAEWAVTDEARMAALSCAGYYLTDHFDRELLELLLNFFENFGETEEIMVMNTGTESLLRACAYNAIAEAMGREWFDIPYFGNIDKLIEEKRFDLIDMSVIDKAKQRLMENK